MTSYMAAVRGTHERNGEYVQTLADDSAVACRRTVAGNVLVFLYPPPVVTDSAAPSWITVSFDADDQSVFIAHGEPVAVSDPLHAGACLHTKPGELTLRLFREGSGLVLECRYTLADSAIKCLRLPFTDAGWREFFTAFQALVKVS